MKRSLVTLAAVLATAAPLPAQVPAGGEFHVNTYTIRHQESPAAAFDTDGSFVVVWTTYENYNSLTEVFAQRYQATGAPIGTEFRVNTMTAGYQWVDWMATPIAMRPDGRFVVVWAYGEVGVEPEVRGQRFDADGARAGAEFRVDSGAVVDSRYANVAIAAHGTFVVVWEASPTPIDRDVYAQMFDATGNRIDTPFRVNLTTAGLAMYGP